jgi:membrane protease YdiL (CAAX protease family)
VTQALLALLLVVLAMLVWRAVSRERRDYARFKRLRSTTLRRKVFRRWILESLLVLGGLSAVVLLAAWQFVPEALRDAREWGPVGAIGDDLAGGLVIGGLIAAVLAMVLPVVLLRGSLDEVPAIGDIRAILPRTRGELPYGAGLALTAGVVEELLFRLALPALIFGITGSGALAFGLAAAVFGLLHLYQGPVGMLFATILGLVFTLLYLLSGSIVLAIALHALLDLRSLVLIPVMLGDAWRPRQTRPSGAVTSES